MGDVAMLVPVIRVLLAQNENVKITVLSRSFLAPIFDEIFIGKKVNFFAVDTKNKHKGIVGIYKLAKEIKKLDITHIADTHNVLRSKLLRTFLIGYRKKAVIDKGRKEKKELVRSQNKIFKQLKTTHQRYADVFKRLGFVIDLSRHHFPKKTDLPNISILDEVSSNGEKWIGIAPFAQYQGKMYPLHLMNQVIEQLAKTTNIFLFGGGEKEVSILNKIADNYNSVICVAGNLNLKEELQLISNLDVMIAMDSGNAHFSAMLGVKTVTIWGVTHPFAGFAPFQQKEYCILPDRNQYPNLPCSIYGNKICQGYEKVMESIPIDRIISMVKR